MDKLSKIKIFENNGRKFYDNKGIRLKKIEDKFLEAKILMSNYIKNYYNNNLNQEIEIKGAYIFNINIMTNEKVIIFGDLHGSYHSFLRLFVRLHIYGVIDFKKYKINDGYKIIFLGDILDRGQYALEILYIISLFIVNNNTDKILKIILNRGNHEDPDLWKNYGFKNELKFKFSTNPNSIQNIENNFYNNIINFLIKCPSAIVLNYEEKKYWLSHGGFPIGNNNTYNFRIPQEKVSFHEESFHVTRQTMSGQIETNYSIGEQIRWCDYHSYDKTNYMGELRGIYPIGRPIIGINKLKEFLKINNISFIIRGHTDNTYNAFLLSSNYQFTNEYQQLNSIEFKEKINTDKLSFPKLDKNKYLKEFYQCNGPTNIIKTNSWLNNNNFIVAYNNNRILYPVLTISTNSDLDRDLNNDSFVVLNFSSNNVDFDKGIIKNNLFNIMQGTKKVNSQPSEGKSIVIQEEKKGNRNFVIRNNHILQNNVDLFQIIEAGAGGTCGYHSLAMGLNMKGITTYSNGNDLRKALISNLHHINNQIESYRNINESLNNIYINNIYEIFNDNSIELPSQENILINIHRRYIVNTIKNKFKNANFIESLKNKINKITEPTIYSNYNKYLKNNKSVNIDKLINDMLNAGILKLNDINFDFDKEKKTLIINTAQNIIQSYINNLSDSKWLDADKNLFPYVSKFIKKNIYIYRSGEKDWIIVEYDSNKTPDNTIFIYNKEQFHFQYLQPLQELKDNFNDMPDKSVFGAYEYSFFTNY